MAVIAATEVISTTRVKTTRVRPSRRRPLRSLTAVLRCLAISEDPLRLTVLARAASDAGYDVMGCSAVEQAWTVTGQETYHLAFMDLAASADAGGARELCEHLVKARRMLVAVCGDEEAPLEEIWARGIGAWLYLPGLTSRQRLQRLCREARPIIERMIKH